MKHRTSTRLALALAALISPALFADHLLLKPAEGTRIAAACGSTVHDFTAEVNAPIVTVETGDGAAGLKSATVQMKFANVRTGDTDRDKDMLKRFEAATHPDITYTVKAFEKDKAGAVIAKGELTWHGVTKELNVPVTITRKGDDLEVDASFTVDHRDWGMKKVRSMLMLTVDPVLKFTVKLRGKLEAMPAAPAPAAADKAAASAAPEKAAAK